MSIPRNKSEPVKDASELNLPVPPVPIGETEMVDPLADATQEEIDEVFEDGEDDAGD